MEHTGKVVAGEIHWEMPGYWISDLQEHEGKSVRVHVRADKRERSSKQNAYLFGVCYRLIAEHLGYETDDIHELMKAKFLEPKRLAIPDDGDVEIPASTRRLNTVEFSKYTENIRRWAAQFLSVNIPDPNLPAED
jgi:hypothetical protein